MATGDLAALRRWLDEYWGRGHEEVALAQWSVTARYAPEKANTYLADLVTLLETIDHERLAEVIDSYGIDPKETGDTGYLEWLTRMITRFGEVLAENRG